jgi:hypothetical protein
VEKPAVEGESQNIAAWHEEESETLAVRAAEFSTFLRVLDAPLAHALAYYLRCESPRDFLVDYYKAVESVFEGLGGERRALAALASHGVSSAEYKRFARYCNEQKGIVLDGSRHAPKPGSTLETLDPKDLWSSSMTREVFECASRVCRSVIEGYIALREADSASAQHRP